MSGVVRVGIGGWTFEPWRGVFYPKGLPQKRELDFASRQLTSIEINGTYYSSFKPASWRRWYEETPDGFQFAVKASRYCTNRKVFAEAGPSIERFLNQGLAELREKLGPINWQLMPTKKFEPDDMAAFFEQLPQTLDGLPLRHAIEVRHPSFCEASFADLARKFGVAVVYAEGDAYPRIDERTAAFVYARLMSTSDKVDTGLTKDGLERIVAQCRAWAKKGDVFVYFIAGAKARNPAAAQALIAMLDSPVTAASPRRRRGKEKGPSA